MSDKLDLYNGIHKAQRKMLFEISLRAGKTDLHDTKQVNTLYDELMAMDEELRSHAGYEERFIHPILTERVSGCARTIEEEHGKMHHDLDDLLNSLDKVKGKLMGSETMPQIGHEFYLAWNRFIAFYLRHIDFEEGHVQPLLWKTCTREELVGTFQSILAA